MSMAELQEAISQIRDCADADFEGPKPESHVVEAEKALSVTFPPTYRCFLKELGCGDCRGFEVYGIIGSDFDNSGIPDAIWITKRERVDSDLPTDLVIVGATGDGGYWALDLAQANNEGEAPVIIWMPGAVNRRREQVQAPDFGSYLLSEIRSRLRDL